MSGVFRLVTLQRMREENEAADRLSPINNLAEQIFEIKEKVTDGEFKSMMEELQKINNSSPKSLYEVEILVPHIQPNDSDPDNSPQLTFLIKTIVVDASKIECPVVKSSIISTNSHRTISGRALEKAAISSFPDCELHFMSARPDEDEAKFTSTNVIIQHVYLIKSKKL